MTGEIHKGGRGFFGVVKCREECQRSFNGELCHQVSVCVSCVCERVAIAQIRALSLQIRPDLVSAEKRKKCHSHSLKTKTHKLG